MDWSTTKPDRPGWWWYRVFGEDPQVIRVYKDRKRRIIAIMDYEYRDVSTIYGQWSDAPISEPKEPK